MMSRGAFAQLMAPGLHDTFEQWVKLRQPSPEYERVFNIVTSKKAYEDEVEFAGLGPLVQKDENKAVIYQDAIEGGTKRYYMLTYALGVRVSFELYEDDQYGLVKRVPEALGRSALFTREQVTWNVINNGFSTTTTTDGLSIFHNTHNLLSGTGATNVLPLPTSAFTTAGTYPNRPATDVDLSFTAIQTMVQQFARLIDGAGLPVSLKPKYLVIPSELRWIAREILGSPGRPGTANNDVNALLGEELQFFIGTYLTSTTAWYGFADKENTQLKHFTRQALDVDYADDFDTRGIKALAFERYAAGATTWPGTWGSNGP